ncbi:MAG: RNA-directed DNA polymerase [Candidatus Omnitrophica bacterium]|nr:RNA-directed DNA polymerase [Candidatus Omnitrophota bacterium]
MLDQSFSAENFRKILDLENRKGVFLEGLFFPNVKDATEEVKQCNKEIRAKKKSKNCSSDDLKKMYEKRRELKTKKDEVLNEELKKVSQNVGAASFSLELDKKDLEGQKSLYTVRNSPECYFVMKQIQRNVSRLFGVKQSNRFEIVSQVKALLDDDFPKVVLKTDIDDFYESIPHGKLLEKIDGNNLLSPFSRRILRQILAQYKKLASCDKGVPRGIGVSAYLAELYMRDLDKAILSHTDVRYYARYVDDIIIIFSPYASGRVGDYKLEIKNIVEQDFHLKLNDSGTNNKTLIFDLSSVKQACEMEYLGYKIFFGDNQIKTKLTDKKVLKYKTRIDSAFSNYFNLSKVDTREARDLLVKRVRFLTGNTRLKNNKNNVLVGIFYTNRQLTEMDDLADLDSYLRKKIKTLRNVRLRDRLRKYKFLEGFNAKRFSPFKTHELQKIMKIWK